MQQYPCNANKVRTILKKSVTIKIVCHQPRRPDIQNLKQKHSLGNWFEIPHDLCSHSNTLTKQTDLESQNPTGTSCNDAGQNSMINPLEISSVTLLLKTGWTVLLSHTKPLWEVLKLGVVTVWDHNLVPRLSSSLDLGSLLLYNNKLLVNSKLYYIG
jgi:hypothetical protein